MKISFIVPVYNVEQYISRCIESILMQKKWTIDFEIVVVNDGTKDKSMEIVNLLVAKEDIIPIRVINQKNSGLSAARNTGMANAHGDYVWFVDSDDWLGENAMQVFADSFKKYPNLDIYVTALNWILGDKILQVDISKRDIYYSSGIDYLLAKNPKGASPRFIIKREYLIHYDIKFMVGVLHEDAHYGHIMPYFASGVYIIPSPVYYYRQRENGSIMSTISIKNAYDCIRIHKDLMSFMKDRINKTEWDMFRLLSRDMFTGLYMYIRRLYWTSDYVIFVFKNGYYIKKECLKCLKESRGLTRLMLLFFIPFPRLTTIFSEKLGSYLLKLR